jgi:predicted ArsR family transcriptional regulator
MELTSVTPDPTALRALAHPVRMRILGLLRTDGPATATGLAQRLGLNSGATSYHLRQLAQHGFVVEDEGRGTARDRWWKAAHQATRTDLGAATDPRAKEAVDAFAQAVAVVHTEWLQRAVEERPLLPDAWRGASSISDWGLRLTPERADELTRAIVALVEGFGEDDEDTEGAEQFVTVLHAFPRPGRIAATPEEPS